MSPLAKRGKSKSLSAAEAGQHGEAGAVTGINAAPQPEAKHMHRGIDEAAVAAPKRVRSA